VTTAAPDNLARHLVDRSASGVVCDPTVAAIAAAVRQALAAEAEPGGRPAEQQAWLAEHGWDAAADQVAQVLGI